MERKAAKSLLQKAAEVSSRKICEAENVIEKDSFPQLHVVRPSKTGAKGLAPESQAECAFLSLAATGEQKLFLPIDATQRICKVKARFRCPLISRNLHPVKKDLTD